MAYSTHLPPVLKGSSPRGLKACEHKNVIFQMAFSCPTSNLSPVQASMVAIEKQKHAGNMSGLRVCFVPCVAVCCQQVAYGHRSPENQKRLAQKSQVCMENVIKYILRAHLSCECGLSLVHHSAAGVTARCGTWHVPGWQWELIKMMRVDHMS